ncbi:Phage integrase family protein [Nonomuraea coxensis DSM 45129]|uniref:Phage integrase family protein n=1 Tax=Nonomuraea coxensis DSM 45129 TaxID=1122611 RepID=A0ABX8U271_9ACTN|nr:tyrosine-type recombinase/integrase [Nonomuraea coxensis]QYC41826.1 Phage integrase family protein [Nonomuraea coxensis DSM 45129]
MSAWRDHLAAAGNRGRDARQALADYLEAERPGDAAASTSAPALLLSASSIAAARPDGRLSARSINTVVAEIGRLHDAQTPDPDRKLGALRPHDARHTFAFQLSQASGHNRAELERRLGHANDRYLRLYTNPPEDIAAGYIEDL